MLPTRRAAARATPGGFAGHHAMGDLVKRAPPPGLKLDHSGALRRVKCRPVGASVRPDEPRGARPRTSAFIREAHRSRRAVSNGSIAGPQRQTEMIQGRGAAWRVSTIADQRLAGLFVLKRTVPCTAVRRGKPGTNRLGMPSSGPEMVGVPWDGDDQRGNRAKTCSGRSPAAVRRRTR